MREILRKETRSVTSEEGEQRSQVVVLRKAFVTHWPGISSDHSGIGVIIKGACGRAFRRRSGANGAAVRASRAVRARSPRRDARFGGGVGANGAAVRALSSSKGRGERDFLRCGRSPWAYSSINEEVADALVLRMSCPISSYILSFMLRTKAEFLGVTLAGRVLISSK